MPRHFTHHSLARTSGCERVFTDDHEHPGSAAPPERDIPADAPVPRPPACRTPPDCT